MKLGASGENGSERLFCVRILCMNAYVPGYDRNTHPERMQEREERRMEERKCVGWQEQETSRLFSAVQEAQGSGAPLRQVFEDLSVDLGRKPNSIRNYYYACLRNQEQNTPRVQAFIPFTEAETHDLLRQVLTGCGQGMSVRACVMRMADGDHSRMLRYQNKYRAILKHHPEMIAQVRQELLAEGVAAPAQGKNPPDEAENRATSQMMAEPCVLKMLEGMKELLQRASAAEEKEQLQRSLDRMRVEQDLRRIAWEKDYDAAVQLIREMRACLESVRNSLDGEKRCDVEDCLAKAASFPNKHAGEA